MWVGTWSDLRRGSSLLIGGGAVARTHFIFEASWPPFFPTPSTIELPRDFRWIVASKFHDSGKFSMIARDAEGSQTILRGTRHLANERATFFRTSWRSRTREIPPPTPVVGFSSLSRLAAGYLWLRNFVEFRDIGGQWAGGTVVNLGKLDPAL